MKHILSLFFLCIFTLTTTAQNQTFIKVEYLQLTKKGVTAYKQLAKLGPNIKVKNQRLYPINDYAIWANAEHIIVAPKESEDPASILSSSWERRKYSWPGGGTLTTVCWCMSEDEPKEGDDCQFNTEQGDEPSQIKCEGSCGCNRTDTFGTTSPTGDPLVKSGPSNL